MSTAHDPMAAVAAADVLGAVRMAQADRVAAEAALLGAISTARATPGVTMDAIAAELGITRDGLYKMLRAAKVASSLAQGMDPLAMEER